MPDRAPCLYPDPAVWTFLPEGFPEWKDPSGFCDHSYCRLADMTRRMARGYPPETRGEREERLADVELMADEFHGRSD